MSKASVGVVGVQVLLLLLASNAGPSSLQSASARSTPDCPVDSVDVEEKQCFDAMFDNRRSICS